MSKLTANADGAGVPPPLPPALFGQAVKSNNAASAKAASTVSAAATEFFGFAEHAADLEEIRLTPPVHFCIQCQTVS